MKFASAIVAILGGWRASLFALLAVLALAGAGVQSWRLTVAHKALAISATKQVKAERDAERAARAEERSRAEAVDHIAAAYEKGKADADAASRAVVSGLRAGNLQLRQRWQGCEARHLPGPATAPGEPDGAADDRIESASRVVRAAAECDAQVRGLQALIRAERQ